MNKLALSLMCLLPLASLYAQNTPKPMPQDVRIKHVVYRDNDVVPVHGVPFTTTHIQFADKETVLDIEGGDTSAWMVTHHPELGNTVFVRPTLFDSNSNMTVITNKHAYYFHLKSSKNVETTRDQQTYALKFVYPEVKSHTGLNKHHGPQTPAQPKVVNTAYRFSGSPQLLPKRVFDDGQFTYFELTTNGAVPAVFAVDNANGKESTVNTRREGKYLVVHRLAPQFTLRQGRLTTSVFNTQEINRIAANRRPQ
ncbi:MAG: P-type conjugative transfer protein VirB9 [Acinetobacter johnsonii]